MKVSLDGFNISFEDEVATRRGLATIIIETPEGERILNAVIEYECGADGGQYPVVKFRDKGWVNGIQHRPKEER